jgi:hypothetical protein
VNAYPREMKPVDQSSSFASLGFIFPAPTISGLPLTPGVRKGCEGPRSDLLDLICLSEGITRLIVESKFA